MVWGYLENEKENINFDHFQICDAVKIESQFWCHGMLPKYENHVK